tara:strand:+ start:178 stop:621 length:444 start_codon:yes stop_codon:yes gene_type:complete
MDLSEIINFTPEEACEKLLLIPEMLEEALELKVIAWKIWKKQDLIIGVKRGMLMQEFKTKPATHGLDPTLKKHTVAEVEAALDRNIALQKLKEKEIDLQVVLDKTQQSISVIYAAKEILLQMDRNVNYSINATDVSNSISGRRRTAK